MNRSDRVRPLVEQFLAERGHVNLAVADDTSLFVSGLLDSIDVLHLVVLLEAQLGIVIAPLDVSLDQLDSIERIRELADRNRSGA